MSFGYDMTFSSHSHKLVQAQMNVYNNYHKLIKKRLYPIVLVSTSKHCKPLYLRCRLDTAADAVVMLVSVYKNSPMITSFKSLGLYKLT